MKNLYRTVVITALLALPIQLLGQGQSSFTRPGPGPHPPRPHSYSGKRRVLTPNGTPRSVLVKTSVASGAVSGSYNLQKNSD